MKEKIIFDDWMEDIRDNKWYHIVIEENDVYISLYENGILKRRKLKEKDK